MIWPLVTGRADGHDFGDSEGQGHRSALDGSYGMQMLARAGFLAVVMLYLVGHITMRCLCIVGARIDGWIMEQPCNGDGIMESYFFKQRVRSKRGLISIGAGRWVPDEVD